MNQPSLRPQDVFVLAKLISYRGPRPPVARMGVDLALSTSEVHGALKGLAISRLVSDEADDGRPLLQPAEEFLLHGVKYAFPAKRGQPTRGLARHRAAVPDGIGWLAPHRNVALVVRQSFRVWSTKV